MYVIYIDGPTWTRREDFVLGADDVLTSRENQDSLCIILRQVVVLNDGSQRDTSLAIPSLADNDFVYKVK